MKFTPRFAAVAALAGSLACVAPVASAATQALGVLDSSIKLFANNYTAPTPSFTDYYTFSITSQGLVAGGTIELDFGSLYNINVNKISLAGGTLAGSLIDLNVNDGFVFGGLGIGSYTMSVSGNVTGLFGGAYAGAIRAIPAVVAAPVPEPEHYLMALLGIAGVGTMVRRGRKGAALV